MDLNLKKFKIKKKFKKGGIHINPNLYWEVSLSFVFILVVGMIVFGYFLFQKTNKDLEATVDNNSNAELISKERIDKALEYFSKRAETSNAILNSPSPIVDPSR